VLIHRTTDPRYEDVFIQPQMLIIHSVLKNSLIKLLKSFIS
jgi:hypothetical protein